MNTEVITHAQDDTSVLENPDLAAPGDEDEVVEDASGEELDALGGANEDDVRFARANGWTPLEDYKGRPEDFETAKSYADRARGINRVLKATNGDLLRRLAATETEIRALKGDKDTEAKRVADAKLTALRAERVQAITDSDGVEVDRIEREIAAIEKPATRVAAPATQAIVLSDEQKEFIADFKVRNPNLDTDPRLKRIFESISLDVRNEGTWQGDPVGFLTETERRARADYPELFRPMRHARTEGGNGQPPAPRKTKAASYANLSREAQQACDSLIRNGTMRGGTDAEKRERYAKQYFQENPNG